MIILLSTGLHDWKIKYLVSCNKGPSPFNDMLYDFLLYIIFSPEVLKVDQLIFRNAKEIYFNEKFPIH